MSHQPPAYVHGHHESVLRSYAWRTAENSAAYLLPHLASGMSVLDVGCGPGTITIDLARRVAPGVVVGVDVSEAPLEGARKEAEAQRLDNVRFGVANVGRLPFADGTYDVVHAHQLLQHLADPVAALSEMARVCKPGGIVAVRDVCASAVAWHPADSALDDWHDLYQRVLRGGGGDPDAGRHLLAWAHAAGFVEVEAGASAWCFSTPADRAWWGETWAERVTHSDFAKQAIEHGLADRDELAALAIAWRRWVDHPDGWFAVLHGEILCRRP
jgi:2-polyprenyl-3-methyl-5-hydroxy-6-metoxy-1,4-benzoquinol methylase